MKHAKQKLIFGVHVDDISLGSALGAVAQRLEHSFGGWIATVNPEILLHARRDAEYTTVLGRAMLRLPDGVGLRYACRVRNRVTGVQMTEKMLELAREQGYSVLCVVWSNGRSSAAEIVQALEKYIHPELIHIVEVQDRTAISANEEKLMQEMLRDYDIRLVFCSLGFPYQEILLENLHSHSPHRSWIGIGNGGTFDYFTGVQSTAPGIVKRFGFEWLWRLLTHPARYKRIINAVAVFPLLYWSSSLRKRSRKQA